MYAKPIHRNHKRCKREEEIYLYKNIRIKQKI